MVIFSNIPYINICIINFLIGNNSKKALFCFPLNDTDFLSFLRLVLRKNRTFHCYVNDINVILIRRIRLMILMMTT